MFEQRGFISLERRELQMRGGISFGTLRKIAIIIGMIVNFAQEYGEDFKRGFRNGASGKPFVKVM